MANKLELTWVGKDEPIRVEPRLLIENAALSNTTTDPGTQNMLIHGDNLLALKALESKYAGQVKCIYIDPPYNTGSAFEHYDDNLEHSQWLNLMRPRLSLLWVEAIAHGWLECPQMPHAETIRMMEVMDQLRADWGLKYPMK